MDGPGRKGRNMDFATQTAIAWASSSSSRPRRARTQEGWKLPDVRQKRGDLKQFWGRKYLGVRAKKLMACSKKRVVDMALHLEDLDWVPVPFLTSDGPL